MEIMKLLAKIAVISVFAIPLIALMTMLLSFGTNLSSTQIVVIETILVSIFTPIGLYMLEE